MYTYLQSDGVMRFFVTVFQFLFFPFLEAAEIILNKECCVEFSYCDFFFTCEFERIGVILTHKFTGSNHPINIDI